MLPRLISNSWPQVICLSWLPKMLGLQAWATAPGPRVFFDLASPLLYLLCSFKLECPSASISTITAGIVSILQGLIIIISLSSSKLFSFFFILLFSWRSTQSGRGDKGDNWVLSCDVIALLWVCAQSPRKAGEWGRNCWVSWKIGNCTLTPVDFHFFFRRGFTCWPGWS